MRAQILKKSILIILALGLALSPVQVAGAQAGPTFPAPAVNTKDGGLIYTFPVNPDANSPRPDPADPNLVAQGFGAPPAAGAQALAAAGMDDRENYQPVAWYVYQHQTLNQILNNVTLYNLRVVDLFVENPYQPYQMTVVLVSNTGVYAKAWALFADVTNADLFNNIASLNLRTISQKVFTDLHFLGDLRYFAVLISNTGADAKTWWFYQDQSVASISNLLVTNNARLVQINSYIKNSTTSYDAVMVSNTGSDARAWWWYVNVSPAAVQNYLLSNNARLLDMDIDPLSGNLNVIMTACQLGCKPDWWWYINISTTQLTTIFSQTGGRMIDANSIPGCSDRCWSFILIDNSHYSISGNTGAGGATLTFTDGTLKTVISDVNGDYSIYLPAGWSGKITPSKTGVPGFTPASRTYTSLADLLAGQNYKPNQLANFTSQASLDGYILESTETSGTGGVINSASSVINLGDDAAKRQYRALLSFNTQSLPDNAVIISARLKIQQQSIIGPNPFASLGPLVIDIRKPYFGAAAALWVEDFSAAASLNAAGSLPNNPVNGLYNGSLKTASFPYINKTGLTQLRLRFQLDDNNDNIANILSIYSGNATNAAFQPKLEVVYSVP